MWNRENQSEAYIPYQPGMEQNSHYLNFAVPKGHPLYGSVADFYQLEANTQVKEICVIPDGCMDMLFRYDGSGVMKTIDGYYHQKVMVQVQQVQSAFGIRFVPGGLANFASMQSSELVGKQVALTDLLDKDPLLDRMEEIQSFEERIEVMTGYLLKKRKENNNASNIVRYCTQQMISSEGSVQIGELSQKTGYTIRYLRNLFHQYVGVSPKELCEMVQFQTSLRGLMNLQKEKKEFSLSDFAVHAGYYDLSHMNKSCQKLVGSVPRKFFLEMNQH